MLNKTRCLFILSAVSLLYFPVSHAKPPGAYAGNGPVNSQAWNGFVRQKQARYDSAHTLDKAPFASSISGGNVVKVDLGKLAWGAYDENGKLVKWGSASGGRKFCDDIGKECRTVTGTYSFYTKKGENHKSNQFPVGRGGSPMPYCMHFKDGYALHGGAVPDFNASHGCIRVPIKEARWLNKNFVKLGVTKIHISY